MLRLARLYPLLALSHNKSFPLTPLFREAKNRRKNTKTCQDDWMLDLLIIQKKAISVTR